MSAAAARRRGSGRGKLEFGPPRGEADVRAYFEILAECFPMAFTAANAPEWLQREDPADMRLARRGRRVVGGLKLVRAGQWFGGRSVPMTGIAAVGVPPEARSAGIATALVRRTLEELRASGCPLSALYPATQPVYRRQGFEQAGTRLRYALPLGAIGVRDRDLEVRPVDESDRETLHALYSQRAACTNGNLDRTPGLWRRVFQPRGKQTRAFAFGGAAGTEGYIVFTNEIPGEGRYSLAATDLVVRTPAAGRRLLSFLADHRSMVTQVTWQGPPCEPLLTLLAEQSQVIVRHEIWMLRVLDVARALEGRGFARHLESELHLEVRDDVLPQNAGRFVLEVCRGEARVRKGGRGRLRLDVRGLAPLFTGHLTPDALRLAGLLEGPEDEAARAAALFAGPAPWMPDFF